MLLKKVYKYHSDYNIYVYIGELLTEYVCTRWYREPEIIVSRQRYSCAVDVWSVGCIWAEMLLGRLIFESSNHFELLSLMFSILGTPSFTYWITDKDSCLLYYY